MQAKLGNPFRMVIRKGIHALSPFALPRKEGLSFGTVALDDRDDPSLKQVRAASKRKDDDMTPTGSSRIAVHRQRFRQGLFHGAIGSFIHSSQIEDQSVRKL